MFAKPIVNQNFSLFGNTGTLMLDWVYNLKGLENFGTQKKFRMNRYNSF